MIMERVPIFHEFTFGDAAQEVMARDGHIVFPRLLTDDAQQKLTKPRSYI